MGSSLAANIDDRNLAGAGARLRGGRLVFARAAWLAVAVLAIGLFAAAVPAEFARMQALCTAPPCEGLLTPERARALEQLGLSAGFYASYDIALSLLAMLTFTGVGVIIFMRRSDEWMGLFSSLVLVLFGSATFTSITDALVAASPAWRLPVDITRYLGQAGFVLFLYLFPDGRFEPAGLRWLALGWAAYQIPATFLPAFVLSFESNLLLAGPLWALFLGGAVLGQIYRYRHTSSALQRQQTKWVVSGISAALSGFLTLVYVIPALFPSIVPVVELYPWLYAAAISLCILLIPLSIGMAILRARLWDIDVLINRALVGGALTACVVGLYVLVVGYLGALFQTSGNLLISLLATGLVAVLFQPLRARLQRVVNRLVYGERDDPYAVVSRLGQRLEAALAPEAVLPTIVETVAQALKLPYAAITLDGAAPDTADEREAIVAAFGRPTTDVMFLPLSYQGELLGQLLLAPPTGGRFSPADRRLLADLTRQAGVAAHAVRLTIDLQRSRERLVGAREEERRRLRRDLHDGLGPQLAGLTLKLDAARNMLDRDPAAARALLDELKGHTQGAIGDIRRLVYALRPPALDDLGLVGALRRQAAQYEAGGLLVSVTADEPLPALPAAAEVAVYRIAQEALTNVVKHAHAQRCWVTLHVNGGVRLSVRDDGRGLADSRLPGVGLSSMAERAAELGGSCQVAPAPEGGVIVSAWLPL